MRRAGERRDTRSSHTWEVANYNAPSVPSSSAHAKRGHTHAQGYGPIDTARTSPGAARRNSYIAAKAHSSSSPG